jgi:hypothetical protein
MLIIIVDGCLCSQAPCKAANTINMSGLIPIIKMTTLLTMFYKGGVPRKCKEFGGVHHIVRYQHNVGRTT